MSVGLATALVKCVEQGCVYQSPRPDHTGGPNNELSQKTAKGKSNNLTADCEEYLVAEGDHLIIEDTLGKYYIGGISTDTRDVTHDSNADVLLDVKGTWVE